jgi:hypothetical protein
MSVGWTGCVIFSRVAAAALAVTTFAVTVNSHAQAPSYPEYHKTWEDGALREPLKKGLKAKGGPKARSGTDISPWTVTHGGSGARYHKAAKSKTLCTSPGSGKPRACYADPERDRRFSRRAMANAANAAPRFG